MTSSTGKLHKFHQKGDDFVLSENGLGANFVHPATNDTALISYLYFTGKQERYVEVQHEQPDWYDRNYKGEESEGSVMAVDPPATHRHSSSTYEVFSTLRDLRKTLSDADGADRIESEKQPARGELSTVKTDFLHPQGEYQRILEFTGKDADTTKSNVKEFLEEFVMEYLQYPSISLPDPWPESKFNGVLSTGRFNEEETKDQSVVLVSMPYLHMETLSRPTNEKDGAEGNIMLEKRQAYFVVIDDNTLAIFRQKETSTPKEPLLLPGQSRQGAFQTLMSLISRLVESEADLMDILEDRARLADTRLSQQKSDILGSSSEADKAQRVRGARDILSGVFKGMRDVSVVAQVAGTQVRVLKQLQKLLRNSTPSVKEGWKPHPGFRRAFSEIVYVPKIRTLGEQIPIVLWMIDEIMGECKQLSRAIEDLYVPVRTSCDSLAQLVSASVCADEAVLQAQKVADEIAWQGETMSMFTAVTTLFLPLNFFSSYFALDDAKKYINTQELFWAIAAPITAIFFFSAAIVILGKEYKYKDMIKAAATFRKPKSRQDYHAEEYRKRQEDLFAITSGLDRGSTAAAPPQGVSQGDQRDSLIKSASSVMV